MASPLFARRVPLPAPFIPVAYARSLRTRLFLLAGKQIFFHFDTVGGVALLKKIGISRLIPCESG